LQPRIDRGFPLSVSGDKVEPAVYSVNIENCGGCRVTVYLDRQRGAFHGTNPKLGSAMFGDPRSTVAAASTTATVIMIRMPVTC
jgi:hypothetical protein